MTEEKQTAPIEPQPPETTTALRDKRITPEGVVPKQAQGYVIAGLAVLILMAVMFSKNHAKPAVKTADSGPLAVATDTNQRKIQELEQDLSADQRQRLGRTMVSDLNPTSSMSRSISPLIRG
jgi:type IV secretion system protein TrbI